MEPESMETNAQDGQEIQNGKTWGIRMDAVHVNTLFGMATGRPLVNVQLQPNAYSDGAEADFKPWPLEYGDTLQFQLEPADARAIALNILSAAFAAEQDGLVSEALARGGVDVPTIGAVLSKTREIREQWEAAETEEEQNQVLATFRDNAQAFIMRHSQDPDQDGR